ncbi:MAG: IGHMBP2 family helicase [Planctomycetota bacterium]|nr:IGHMBP2 family helicase [Planctomycetota bacterium]
MPVLHIESLPAGVRKADVIHLLVDDGGIQQRRLGLIDLHGSHASVEVPEGWESRLARLLDGTVFKHKRIRAWTGGSLANSTGEEGHFKKLARLLEMEAEAEVERMMENIQNLAPADAERSGEALINLTIDEQQPGLGGRFILTLSKRNRELKLPWTRLRIGTPILLTAEGPKADANYRGVICDRSRNSIKVAIKVWPEEETELTWRIDHSTDETGRQRQLAALERARAARGNRLAEMRRILIEDVRPSFIQAAESVAPSSRSLNETQLEAVRFALSANDVALIHGPPGTGKTTTVVELIRQAVQGGDKVLVCAPSNLAVDNLLERLVAAEENVLRLGHPARIMEHLRDHSLDYVVESHDNLKQVRKLTKEAFRVRHKAQKAKDNRDPSAGELFRESREMLDDARRLEAQTIESVLTSADILCSTTTGIDSDILGQRQFDLAVIDEACQCTEPESWIPVLRTRRLVLAGDHCQLPPTVVSTDAAREGFGISMFERLMDEYGQDIARRLNIQYRMHESIMEFSSLEFYECELLPHDSVSEHLLQDLDGIESNELTATPVTFIDTAGAGYDEELEPDGQSRQNPSEAELVQKKVQTLLDSGVPPDAIGVISPYAAQVRHLRQLMGDLGVEIDSVDGFQGREKEAIVISMVRSNDTGEIGFLGDIRRMNVAMTRARRKLMVIGDSATISSHKFYQRVLDHFDRIGAYHTVWEEME